MSVPTLKLDQLNRGLPPYFKDKLQEIAEQEPRDDLIKAELNRYHEAAMLAIGLNFNLKDLLMFAEKTPEEQYKVIPSLENKPNLITLRSPIFLSAIAYTCFINESEDPERQGEYKDTEVKLPIYFLKRYKALKDSEEKERLLKVFDEATRLVETTSFKLAAVIDTKKHDLVSEVALHSIRYVCYANESPGSREVRLLTDRGSRVKVLSV